MSGLVQNSKHFPHTGNEAPRLWVENYRAVVGGCRRIPRPLSEHAGGRGRKLEGWGGMFLISQNYSASYKMSGSGLLSNNLVVLSSTYSCRNRTVCQVVSWY